MHSAFHACPGCNRIAVHNRRLACRPCWFRLPKQHRQAVTDAKPGTPQHRAALFHALTWYSQNPLEATT
jgi:hypothetical protein